MMMKKMFHLLTIMNDFHACEWDEAVQPLVMTMTIPLDDGAILSLVHHHHEDDVEVLPPGHHASNHVYRKWKYDS